MPKTLKDAYLSKDPAALVIKHAGSADSVTRSHLNQAAREVDLFIDKKLEKKFQLNRQIRDGDTELTAKVARLEKFISRFEKFKASIENLSTDSFKK